MGKDTGLPPMPDISSVFPPPTWEQWKQAVDDTLKGVPFEKAMITKTYEGIDLQPIYRKEDIAGLPHLASLPGQSPFVRGNHADGYLTHGWLIAQSQSAWNPAEANKVLLDELNRGLNTVNLKLDKYTKWATIPASDSFEPDGIILNDLTDLTILLTGIDLMAVPIMIEGGEASPVILALLASYLQQQNQNPQILKGFIGFDLLTALLTDGELPYSEAEKWQPVYQMCLWADNHAPDLRTILLDGSFWGSRGADSLTELTCLISQAAEYLKSLLALGLKIEQLAPRFQINLTLGSNLFMEIAKVRAARLLWAELMQAFGAPEALRSVWIHGITSSFNKTIYDPYVNVLRTTTESFSGIIGGVDSLEVLPFDHEIRTDNEFSRRIARNQQIILQEEAHLSRVTDPSGGCFYVEAMTAKLAENAWLKMQKIEQDGGFYSSIQQGLVHAEITRIASSRKKNVDIRKDVFVGVNMYANTIEQPLEQTEGCCGCEIRKHIDKALETQASERPGLEIALQKLSEFKNTADMLDYAREAFLRGSTLEETFDLIASSDGYISAAVIPSGHATEDLEELRMKITAFQQDNEVALSVFLANMGPVLQHKARADFASGFLQVGGFYVAGNDGFATVDEAAEATIFSGAQAVCICSTDDTYTELVPQLIDNIRQKEPRMVFLLAGYPQEMVEKYQELGIDCFIHLRANVLDTLQDLAARMGVK